MNPMDGPSAAEYTAKRLEEARKMADDLRQQRRDEIDTKIASVKPIVIGIAGQTGDPVRALDQM